VGLNTFGSRIVQQVRNEIFSHETLSLVRYKNKCFHTPCYTFF
jgi:hypothetical protein